MLTSFNLPSHISVETFRELLAGFSAELVEADLIDSIGSLGRRQRHPVMDTDDREQEFYFVLSFRDREHCDRAVEVMYRQDAEPDSMHKTVYALVNDPVFTCWEDV